MNNFTSGPFSPYTSPASSSSFFSNMSLLQQHDMEGRPPFPESLQFPDNNIDEPVRFPTPPSTLIPDSIPYFQFPPPSQEPYQTPNLHFPPPYEAPFEIPNLHFPYTERRNTTPQWMNQVVNNNDYNPLLPFSMEQQNSVRVPFNMQDYHQLEDLSQPLDLEQPPLQEEERKSFVATSTKVSRDRKRNYNRKRSKIATSSASHLEATTMKVTNNIEKKIRNVFNTPDGKKLLKIFTKKLMKSDVGNKNRIVLPKRKVKEELPRLGERKVSATIVLQDVYSEHRWALRYRYWDNSKSRMYVLESVGDFLRHYGLKMGDYMTLYKDQSNVQGREHKTQTKDLHHPVYYVKIKKDENGEALEPSSYAKEGEGESSSTEEVSSDRMEEESGGGRSSSRGESEEPGNVEGAWNWVSGEEDGAKEAAETSWMRLHAPMTGDDLVVYGELDNILDVEGRFSSF